MTQIIRALLSSCVQSRSRDPVRDKPDTHHGNPLDMLRLMRMSVAGERAEVRAHLLIHHKQPHLPRLYQPSVTGTGSGAGEGRAPRAGRTAAAARARRAAAAAATCAPPRGRARPRRPRCCWRPPSSRRLRGPPCTAGREARVEPGAGYHEQQKCDARLGPGGGHWTADREAEPGLWRRASCTALCGARGGPGEADRAQRVVKLGRGLAGKRCRPALRATGRRGRPCICECAAHCGVAAPRQSVALASALRK
jgi:hypothetical protein